MKLQKNQKVYFIGEDLPMKVMAISERYAVCSRKLHQGVDYDFIRNGIEGVEMKYDSNIRLEYFYSHTVIDLKENIRTASIYVLGVYNSEESCERLLSRVILKPNDTFRNDNTVKLLIDDERTFKMSDKGVKSIWGEYLYNIFAEHIDEDGWLTSDFAEIIDNKLKDWDEDYVTTNERSKAYYRVYNTDFEESEDGLKIRPINRIFNNRTL
ncbi:hypothetical protein FO615_06020 [Riemerella anatipestifer]|uniref:hypothetical protein n=1 Tax=Riemerella anatipestifer TaxID=34085 RepID=UPI0023643D5D|nr:hypothetical protein [Riemerella anatipestifer]MDD1553133.1 hypothetical protein [Riemerella anatipestifer]MDD1596176.1 hypothetical protein [Riemerella anatipestifer]MDY3334237.1 hypothetical protein [Riemerella anatipestifer]MDY3380696.1 hypothetical protein [Riemerella anatipestifer]MDY3384623.1 hypothetical protein [Riemerella anatipestifer]